MSSPGDSIGTAVTAHSEGEVITYLKALKGKA